MTQLTRVVFWWLFMRNRPRILFQPTHLENLDQISRIEPPWNPTKLFISTDSAWSTDSFLIFPPGSTFLEKSWLLGIQPRYRSYPIIGRKTRFKISVSSLNQIRRRPGVYNSWISYTAYVRVLCARCFCVFSSIKDFRKILIETKSY